MLGCHNKKLVATTKINGLVFKQSTWFLQPSLSLHVLAVLKVLIAQTIFNLHNCEIKRYTTKKPRRNLQMSLEDLVILLCPYLTYLAPFQGYGGLKKIGAINSFENESTNSSRLA